MLRVSMWVPYEYKCIVINTAYHNWISFSHCLTIGNHKKASLMLKSVGYVPHILPESMLNLRRKEQTCLLFEVWLSIQAKWGRITVLPSQLGSHWHGAVWQETCESSALRTFLLVLDTPSCPIIAVHFCILKSEFGALHVHCIILNAGYGNCTEYWLDWCLREFGPISLMPLWHKVHNSARCWFFSVGESNIIEINRINYEFETRLVLMCRIELEHS